jgi:hypothetical protein
MHLKTVILFRQHCGSIVTIGLPDGAGPVREVARYPQPTQEVALSNHCRVCSSLQPGTAKRAPPVTPWLGRTMSWLGRTKECRGLARCAVAASVEAPRASRSPRAKTERIAFAPTNLSPFLSGRQAAPPQSAVAPRPVKSAAPSVRTPASASARPLRNNLSAAYRQADKPESTRGHKHLLRTNPQAGLSFQQAPRFLDPFRRNHFRPRRNRFRRPAKAAGNGRKCSVPSLVNNEVASCLRF